MADQLPRRVAIRMKKPAADKKIEDEISRHDVEILVGSARRHAELLRRLKTAILSGDTLLEHELAREVCGLPKPKAQ